MTRSNPATARHQRAPMRNDRFGKQPLLYSERSNVATNQRLSTRTSAISVTPMTRHQNADVSFVVCFASSSRRFDRSAFVVAGLEASSFGDLGRTIGDSAFLSTALFSAMTPTACVNAGIKLGRTVIKINAAATIRAASRASKAIVVGLIQSLSANCPYPHRKGPDLRTLISCSSSSTSAKRTRPSERNHSLWRHRRRLYAPI